jgi:hypothetical protein
VTEPKPYVSIVREPDLRRLAAAARAIEPELERLHSAAAGRLDLLAGLYASRAIVADDEYGRGAGLVIQADGLRWAELDELARLVEPQLDPTRHAGAGTWHPHCPDCRGALAAARIRTHRRYRTVGPT